MGALRIFGRGEGDDQKDSHSAFCTWQENFWKSQQRKRGLLSSYAAIASLPVEADEETMLEYESDDSEDEGGEPLVGASIVLLCMCMWVCVCGCVWVCGCGYSWMMMYVYT
jgi:hypothetical protein